MKKRRIKLLASITSMVLVVAVMAVGVLAASKATVGITGNVAYSTKGNVSATVSAKVELVQENATADVQWTTSKAPADSYSDTIAPTAASYTDSGKLAFSGLEITADDGVASSHKFAIVVTVTITNGYKTATTDKDQIAVNLAHGTNHKGFALVTTEDKTTYSTTVAASDVTTTGDVSTPITVNGTLTLVYIYSATAGTGFTATDAAFDIDLTLTAAAAS